MSDTLDEVSAPIPRPDRARRERLRWLAHLRWWAIGGGMVGVLVAQALHWTFVSVPAAMGGLLFMVLVNSVLLWRTNRTSRPMVRRMIPSAFVNGQSELLVHAAVDLGLLTWMLAWAGGVRNPLAVAYSFHVVIGTMLAGRIGALFSSGASLCAMGALWLLEEAGALPTPPLHAPPALLWQLSLGLLVVGLGYLALEIAERQTHERARARVVEQRHLMLERLATIGRAMQGVAHELNTPLTTMQTLAKDLRAALQDASLDDALRTDVEESLQLLIEESRRCRTLTQGLLSTANDGSRTRGHQPLLDVARRAVRMVAPAGGTAVKLDEDSLRAAPTVDSDRTMQILMNLVQNALVATEGVTGEAPRVVVDAVEVGAQVQVRIRDRGPGLPPTVRERLFEPFVTTKVEGTGLGLYTSQQIAQQLGGRLVVDDAAGGGTVAILSLPHTPAGRGAAPIEGRGTLSVRDQGAKAAP